MVFAVNTQVLVQVLKVFAYDIEGLVVVRYARQAQAKIARWDAAACDFPFAAIAVKVDLCTYQQKKLHVFFREVYSRRSRLSPATQSS